MSELVKRFELEVVDVIVNGIAWEGAKSLDHTLAPYSLPTEPAPVAKFMECGLGFLTVITKPEPQDQCQSGSTRRSRRSKRLELSSGPTSPAGTGTRYR